MVETQTMATTGEIISKKPTACVVFPGFMAGGPNAERQKQAVEAEFGVDNVLTFASASTKFSAVGAELTPTTFSPRLDRVGRLITRLHLKKQEERKTNYYDQLATKIAEKFKDVSSIVFALHSGGGVEGIETMKALLKRPDFHDKKIDMLLTSVPGMVEATSVGPIRALDFAVRFVKMGALRVQNQHFDLYPPPEEYYARPQEQKSEEGNSQYQVVYKDNADTRQARRERFFTDFVEKGTENEVRNTLTEKDKNIVTAIKSKDKKALDAAMKERAKYVFEIGDTYYKNKSQEERFQVSTEYNASIIGAIYMLRAISSVWTGIENKMADLMTKAKQNDVEINFTVGVFEKDEIIKLKDLSNLEKRLDKAGLQDAVTVFGMEALSHESIDNFPQGGMAAIRAIK